jgi:hypothetical protein
VTVQPAPGADAAIGELVFRMVNNLRFTGTGGSMKIGGLDLDPSDSDPSWSHDLTFDHLTWTAGAIVRTRGTNQSILFHSSMFDNLPPPLYEGRVTVRGYNNTEPVGVTITNSHFGGGCSDGVQVIGHPYGVQIGPGNEFTGLMQSGCDAHVDAIQLYGGTRTVVTSNFFHDNGDGSGGIMSPDGDDYVTVAGNVFVCSCEYPWSIAAGGADGWAIKHNTFVGGQLRIADANNGDSSSGNLVRDNLWTKRGGLSTEGDYGTNDHNLNSGQPGTGNRTGTPVFVGGAHPTSRAGFKLAPRSPGRNAASDGSDMGIRVPG